MDQAEKVARQRLSVLELAEALGNVSQAYRQRGMTRTQFYEYKRRFQTHGLEGLKDLPPIHKSHPQTTPPAVVERILTLSLEHRLSPYRQNPGVCRRRAPQRRTALLPPKGPAGDRRPYR